MTVTMMMMMMMKVTLVVMINHLPVQVKSSADHVVLYLCQSLLRHLLPECVRRRVWRLFYARSSLLVSNLAGPDCALSVGGRQVRDVMFWFPPLEDAAVSVSFLTYAGQLYMTVAADRAVLANPDFVTTAFVAEVGNSSP